MQIKPTPPSMSRAYRPLILAPALVSRKVAHALLEDGIFMRPDHADKPLCTIQQHLCSMRIECRRSTCLEAVPLFGSDIVQQ